MKILCIGSSILETTCVINEVISEGQKLKIENKIESGAGHAGNIAYLLSKWGVETYIASMLGADDAAAKIKKEYENIGTKTDFIETSYDKQTGTSLVLVNQINKNNTVFEIASNIVLKKYAFNFEPDVIVIDGNDYNASMAALDKYPNAKSFLVVNHHNNDVNELGKFVKNIIFNRKMAETISNIKIDYNDSNTLVNVYNKLKQKHSNAEIIVTLGERGSIYSINGQIKIIPPVIVDIVDTNGAGDIYAGAFVYGMSREFGLEKSIAYATIAASFSTTKLTSRGSIPTLTEVSNYYDSKFGIQNNPNNSTTNNNREHENESIQTEVTPNINQVSANIEASTQASEVNNNVNA